MDEWAAVVIHKAEVEKKMDEDKRKLHKEQQRKYKEELDLQALEAREKAKKNILKGGGFVLSKEDQERLAQQRKKATHEELLREMEEHKNINIHDKSRAMLENQVFEEYLKLQKETDEKKKNEELLKKNQIAANLRSSYASHAQAKRAEVDLQREIDRKMLGQEAAVWPMVDSESKKVTWLCIWRLIT